MCNVAQLLFGVTHPKQDIELNADYLVRGDSIIVQYVKHTFLIKSKVLYYPTFISTASIKRH